MKTGTNRVFLAGLSLFWWVALIYITSAQYPISDKGDFPIRATIDLALLYWAIAVGVNLSQKSGDNSSRFAPARLLWTLACGAYLVHVAVAFEYAHHWSHAEAFEHVRQASGFGEGIFVSYFFTLLWTVDVIWWWIDRVCYERRPRWLNIAIHGFMVFIIINATIIFESGPIRWIGIAVLIGLGGLLWRSKTANLLKLRFEE